MKKAVKLNTPIYIGQDVLGRHLLKINITRINDGYSIEPEILTDNNDSSLITIKNNLSKLLSVKEENGVLSLNIIGKDSQSNVVSRTLGTIHDKKFTPTVKLTTLELKMLSMGTNNNEMDRVFANEREVPSSHTDLHTHYAGQISGKDIYDIALKTSPETIIFSPERLAEIEITSNKPMNLKEVNKIKGAREKIIQNMSINPKEQITFMDMDELYKNRNPFFDSDDPKLIKNYVLKIAEDYARSGVKYCELSTCPWMFRGCTAEESKKRHEIFAKAVKDAKEKYGVDVAFLLATPRIKRDGKSLSSFVDSFIDEVNFPLVAGIDLLGHEITSNKDYNYMFAAATKMCALHGLRNFTIRSHAGESGEYIDNIKDFLKCIKTEMEKIKKDNPNIDKDFFPNIRIGHGLHGGLDDETIALIKETGAIIEINASSNMSLNNITELNQIPIRKYLDNNVNVVLGSDGGGLYGTDAKQEALIAHQIGVSVEELQKMVNFEDKYIDEKIKEAEYRKGIKKESRLTYEPDTVDKPSIEQAKISCNTQFVEEDLAKDNPVFICGAEERLNDNELDGLLEKRIEEIINKVKKEAKYNSVCIYDDSSYVSSLVEAKCNELGVKLHKLNDSNKSHDTAYGNDKYDVSKKITSFCKKTSSCVFVLGGGNFASDVIVNCENKGVRWITESRIPGASQNHFKLRSQERDKNTEEKQKEEVIRNVQESNKKPKGR